MSSSLVGVIEVTNSLLDMSSFSRSPSNPWKAVEWLFLLPSF